MECHGKWLPMKLMKLEEFTNFILMVIFWPWQTSQSIYQPKKPHIGPRKVPENHKFQRLGVKSFRALPRYKEEIGSKCSLKLTEIWESTITIHSKQFGINEG